MIVEPALFGLTLGLYLLSSVAYHVHVFAGSDRARYVAWAFAGAGAVAHLTAIGMWCTSHKGASILQDPAMPASLAAWFVALGQLAAGSRRGWAAVGAISMPIAFVAQFYAEWMMPGSSVQPSAHSSILSPHVLAILLGFAAFALAFCLAVLYLVQARLLKEKRVRGLFSRLPPLESVANAAHWLATIGLSLLTLGVVTGIIAAPATWGPSWYLDPRFLTAVFAWTIYAAYIAASMLMGWRGRRTTYFLIAGFLVVLIAFAASVARPRGGTHASAASRLGAAGYAARSFQARPLLGAELRCTAQAGTLAGYFAAAAPRLNYAPQRVLKEMLE